MLTPDLVLLFTSRLEDCRIPYFVTGSVASILYGEPRLIQDVDLVLGLTVRHIQALQGAFPEDHSTSPSERFWRSRCAASRVPIST